MEKNNDILYELRDISPLLAEIPRINIQSVPFGYFHKLEERICINSILMQNETKEYFKHKKPGVPSGYFENLSDSILSKIKNDHNTESEEVYPLLESLKNKHVFKVPDGYFDDLSNQIIAGTRIKEEAKVISIGRNKWWKYAAAAIIAGILLISGLFIFKPDNNQVSRYLAASQQYQTATQIEDGIASLRDDDIVNYLETHGNITDNEILINNIDTDFLPAELDYLIDENTLHNYLIKINDDQK